MPTCAGRSPAPSTSFGSAGQLCVHAERVVLHESIADAFLADYVPAVAAMRLGPALEYGVDMRTLVSQRQLDRVRPTSPTRSPRVPRCSSAAARPDLGPFFMADRGSPRPATACRNDRQPGGVIYRVRSDETRSPRQRHGIRAQCVDLEPRRRRAHSPPDRAPSTSMMGMPRLGASGLPWAGWGSRAWASAWARRDHEVHREPDHRGPAPRADRAVRRSGRSAVRHCVDRGPQTPAALRAAVTVPNAEEQQSGSSGADPQTAHRSKPDAVGARVAAGTVAVPPAAVGRSPGTAPRWRSARSALGSWGSFARRCSLR
jgi:hypothetical protein